MVDTKQLPNIYWLLARAPDVIHTFVHRLCGQVIRPVFASQSLSRSDAEYPTRFRPSAPRTWLTLQRSESSIDRNLFWAGWAPRSARGNTETFLPGSPFRIFWTLRFPSFLVEVLYLYATSASLISYPQDLIFTLGEGGVCSVNPLRRTTYWNVSFGWMPPGGYRTRLIGLPPGKYRVFVCAWLFLIGHHRASMALNPANTIRRKA